MWELIKKEIRLEMRNRFALGGISLYLLSTIYICYLSFRQILHPATWNALFWIIMLFSAMNAIGKSFSFESKGRQFYYYTLFSARQVILSKMIYNIFLMLGLSFAGFMLYAIFISNLVQDHLLFMMCIMLGSTGFSVILTMISAIAAKTDGNFSLMAILSFPMMIPFLMVLIKVSKFALDGIDRSLAYPYLGILICLNIIVAALSFILFPYLWRD